jgi:serine/threonine protein kinase
MRKEKPEILQSHMMTRTQVIDALSTGYTTLQQPTEFSKPPSEIEFSKTTMFTQSDLALAVPAYLSVTEHDFKQIKLLTDEGVGVYLGEMVATGQSVVIKYVHKDKKIAFDQEVSIMAMLKKDPFIAKIVGFCVEPQCILMAYYPMGSLREFMAKRILRMQQKVGILHDIARGILALHRAGLAHCDIKPANVLMETPTKAVVTDFGISTVVSDRVLLVRDFEVSTIIGLSLLYAAPEAILRIRRRPFYGNSTVMMAGDVYAVGIIIIELLTRYLRW